MTWTEIKKAVEEAGVREDEEIALIQCENGKGDHTFHRVTIRQETEASGKRLRGSVAERGWRVCSLSVDAGLEFKCDGAREIGRKAVKFREMGSYKRAIFIATCALFCGVLSHTGTADYFQRPDH